MVCNIFIRFSFASHSINTRKQVGLSKQYLTVKEYVREVFVNDTTHFSSAVLKHKKTLLNLDPIIITFIRHPSFET